MAAIFELSLGLFAVCLGEWFGSPPHATMPKLHEGWKLLSSVGDGILLGGLMVLFILGLERLNLQWFETASQAGTQQAKELFQGASIGHILAISLAAGAGEELLFRGWLQGWLEMRFQGTGELAPWLAIFLSSLAFGIVHPLSRGYIVLVFGLGILLGTTFYLTDNILVPIVGHAAYDAVMMARLLRELSPEESNK